MGLKEPSVLLVGVGDFALPVPRKGSIETLSGFGDAARTGLEVHQQIQAKRARVFEDWESEVPVSADFVRGDYLFRIAGRMDGMRPGKPARIEEIKTSFNVHELSSRLRDKAGDHPYCLQLKTYGYFHWLQTGHVPRLSFHLVSTRHWNSEDIEISLDLPSFEAWLELRLAELVEEAKLSEKRLKRRRNIAADLTFPFAVPRPGQTDLVTTIEEGMKQEQRMLIQAPTGLGKTIGVLYPTLREALGRGQRVVYLTPKNSQHQVAEDAVTHMQQSTGPLKSMTVTAKAKICFKNEPLCNPDYCEYAKNYYGKVQEHRLAEKLAKKKKLTRRSFRELGEKYEVCPFELQFEAAPEADTIICDYNYVFAPRAAAGRLAATSTGQSGKPNLVIDEVHNLPARAMSYYSPSLSTVVLEKTRGYFQQLDNRFRSEALLLLDACIRLVRECVPGANAPVKIDPPVEAFLEQDQPVRALLSKYLESDVTILPGDPVLRFSQYWTEFTSVLEFVGHNPTDEFFTTFQPLPSGGMIKITCCDASKMLSDHYDNFEHVVGFSATLKPFTYYSRLTGLDPDRLKTAEFASPFPKERRKILIIPQLSTKYAGRARNAPRIAETIQKISSLKPGNYFAFFPSFEFLEQVSRHFTPPEGFKVVKQARSMKSDEISAVLDDLRAGATPTLVFAVQGGVFSEGVDYPGEMMIGAFIVGPPLPVFDLEREEMRRYYDQHFEAGFGYAYAFPAMAKAVQAAGRIIRSETDRGLIVLMDDRFLHGDYTESMPQDWFGTEASELVSEKILQDVTAFWDEHA